MKAKRCHICGKCKFKKYGKHICQSKDVKISTSLYEACIDRKFVTELINDHGYNRINLLTDDVWFEDENGREFESEQDMIKIKKRESRNKKIKDILDEKM